MPPAVLRRLAARFPARYPLLLDSAAAGPLSRASVLLGEPTAELWLDAEGRLGARGFAPEGTTFLGALENWWRSESCTEPATAAAAGEAALPFTGGWGVFLAYEMARRCGSASFAASSERRV